MTGDVTPHRLKAVTPHRLKLDKDAQEVADRMRAIETVLASNGLTTHLTDARSGLDLTAVLSPSGKREAEIWIDEDGHVELHYWSPADSTPEQVATVALRALHRDQIHSPRTTRRLGRAEEPARERARSPPAGLTVLLNEHPFPQPCRGFLQLRPTGQTSDGQEFAVRPALQPLTVDPAELSHSSIAQLLGRLHSQYPAFRFLREPVGGLGQRWIAEHIVGLDSGLHTLITADFDELHGELDADEARHAHDRA